MGESLGALVRRCRGVRSLKVLAAQSGVSRAHLHEIERGVSANPTVDVLVKLSVALGVAPSELFAAALESRK